MKEIMSITHRAYTALLDFLFPPTCVACAHVGFWLCDTCRLTLKSSHRRADAHTLAATNFTGPARQLIHRTKYSGARDAAHTVADIIYDVCMEDISEHLALYPSAKLVVTYIPARTKTVRERGYNHAEAIAHHLATQLDAPLIATLAYVKDIPLMARTRSRAQRAQLLHKSMSSILTEPLSNTLLVIVDDVITTGSTMREAHRALSCDTTITPLGLTFAHTPRSTTQTK